VPAGSVGHVLQREIPPRVRATPRAALRRRGRRSESGIEAIWTVLFVIPFMFILVFATIDFGVMFAARSAVNGVLTDAVRQVSAYGGDGPFSYQPPPYTSFSSQASARLNSNGNGGTGCLYGPCESGHPPIQVRCGRYSDSGQWIGGNARYLGDTVGCEIVGEYPFKGVTGGLLDPPLAAGFGGIVGPFDAKVLGKSETGDNPSVD